MSAFQRKQSGKMAQSLVDVIGKSPIYKRYKKLFIDAIKGQDYTPGEKKIMGADLSKKIVASQELKNLTGGTIVGGTVGGTLATVVTKKLLSDVNKNNNKTKSTSNTNKKDKPKKSVYDTYQKIREKNKRDRKNRLFLKKLKEKEKITPREKAIKNEAKVKMTAREKAIRKEKEVTQLRPKLRPKPRPKLRPKPRPRLRPSSVTKNNKK